MFKDFENDNTYYLTKRFLDLCLLEPSQEILSFAIYDLRSEDPDVYMTAFPIFSGSCWNK